LQSWILVAVLRSASIGDMPSLFGKTKAAEAERASKDEDAASAPPPSYEDSAADAKVPGPGHAPARPSYDRVPSGQPPIDLADAFAHLKVSPMPRDPDVPACLVHLKLLAAFQAMKEEIGYTDGLWGIWDTLADDVSIGDPQKPSALSSSEPPAAFAGTPNPSELKPGDKMAALSRLREKRWALFVARAVDRYISWWQSMYWPCLTEQNMAIPQDPLYEAFPLGEDQMRWTPNMLPPLGA